MHVVAARAFLRWCDAASSLRRHRESLGRVLARWGHLSLVRALDQWRGRMQEAQRMRRLEARVLARMQHRESALAFDGWQFAVRQGRINWGRRETTGRRWRLHQHGRAFGRWREAVAELRRIRSLMSRVVLRWENLQKSTVFVRWYEHLHAVTRMRAVGGAVVQRMLHRALAAALSAWAANARRLRDTRGRLVRAAKRWLGGQAAAALQRWRETAGELARARWVLARAITRWEGACVVRALERWVQMCAEARRMRALEGRAMRRMLGEKSGAAFDSWRLYAAERAARDDAVAHARARAGARALAAALRSWGSVVGPSRRMSAATQESAPPSPEKAADGAGALPAIPVPPLSAAALNSQRAAVFRALEWASGLGAKPLKRFVMDKWRRLLCETGALGRAPSAEGGGLVERFAAVALALVPEEGVQGAAEERLLSEVAHALRVPAEAVQVLAGAAGGERAVVALSGVDFAPGEERLSASAELAAALVAQARDPESRLRLQPIGRRVAGAEDCGGLSRALAGLLQSERADVALLREELAAAVAAGAEGIAEVARLGAKLAHVTQHAVGMLLFIHLKAAWRVFVERAQASIRRTRRMRAVVARLLLGAAARALALWRVRVGDARRHRALLTRGVQRWRAGALGAALALWAEHAAELAAARDAVRRVVGRLGHRCLAAAFAAWAARLGGASAGDAVAQAAWHSVDARRAGRVVARAFAALASAAWGARLLRRVAEQGAARRRRRALAAALERWEGGARARRAWRPVKERAVGVYEDSLLRAALDTWALPSGGAGGGGAAALVVGGEDGGDVELSSRGSGAGSVRLDERAFSAIVGAAKGARAADRAAVAGAARHASWVLLRCLAAWRARTAARQVRALAMEKAALLAAVQGALADHADLAAAFRALYSPPPRRRARARVLLAPAPHAAEAPRAAERVPFPTYSTVHAPPAPPPARARPGAGRAARGLREGFELAGGGGKRGGVAWGQWPWERERGPARVGAPTRMGAPTRVGLWREAGRAAEEAKYELGARAAEAEGIVVFDRGAAAEKLLAEDPAAAVGSGAAPGLADGGGERGGGSGDATPIALRAGGGALQRSPSRPWLSVSASPGRKWGEGENPRL